MTIWYANLTTKQEIVQQDFDVHKTMNTVSTKCFIKTLSKEKKDCSEIVTVIRRTENIWELSEKVFQTFRLVQHAHSLNLEVWAPAKGSERRSPTLTYGMVRQHEPNADLWYGQKEGAQWVVFVCILLLFFPYLTTLVILTEYWAAFVDVSVHSFCSPA